MLLVSLTGLLHIMHDSGLTGKLHESLGAQSAGGGLRFITFEYAGWMLGKIGAVIVYATVALIGVLFLTNFKLGAWLQDWFNRKPLPAVKSSDPQEAALERKARELEKKSAPSKKKSRSPLPSLAKPFPSARPWVRILSRFPNRTCAI